MSGYARYIREHDTHCPGVDEPLTDTPPEPDDVKLLLGSQVATFKAVVTDQGMRKSVTSGVELLWGRVEYDGETYDVWWSPGHDCWWGRDQSEVPPRATKPR